MGLKRTIQDDVKAAMRARDKQRLAVLRLITAALKQREVDERIELDDEGVLGVLDKMRKQRNESIQQYTEAGRDDLAAQENFELDIIQAYLPRQLTADEIAALVDSVVADVGATSMKDMGPVMKQLKSQVQGRADMKLVSETVRSRLGA